MNISLDASLDASSEGKRFVAFPPDAAGLSSTGALVEVVPLVLIGEVLIAIRKERGLSQQALADLLHIDQAVVARMELAKYRSTSLERLVRIAEALGVSFRLVYLPIVP